MTPREPLRPVSRFVAICGHDFCIFAQSLCLHFSAPKLTAPEQGGCKLLDIGDCGWSILKLNGVSSGTLD